MADGTHIEWTDATWNVVNGCSVVSPGCTNCYAMRLAGTRLKHHASRAGLTVDSKAGPVWTGETRFNEPVLLDPLKWRRPRRIFVCAHGDLFHDSVPDDWIDRVFAVMALAPRHQFQLLTKRPERMRDYLRADRRDEMNSHAGTMMHWDAMPSTDWPLPNVWLGVSVEDQARAEERIRLLLQTPAAVRWLSCEPLLGPVDLTCVTISGDAEMDCINPRDWADEVEQWRGSSDIWEDDFEDWFGRFPDQVSGQMHQTIDWVVAGGESGPGARPMHPDWARSLRDQCAQAGVPFLFKQWGNWGPDEGPPSTGRDTIFEGSARAAVQVDGSWRYLDNGFQGPIEWCERADDWLFHIGKGKAGRLLDGVQHDGFPA